MIATNQQGLKLKCMIATNQQGLKLKCIQLTHLKDSGLTLTCVPLVSSKYWFKVYIILLHMKFSFKYNEENNEN